MNLFSQHIKAKKSEKLKKKFCYNISKLEKSEQNRLLDNFRKILDKKKSTLTHFCAIVEVTLLTVLNPVNTNNVRLASTFVLIG